MGTCLTRARSTENSDKLPWHLSFVANAGDKKTILQLAHLPNFSYIPSPPHRQPRWCQISCLQWRSVTICLQLNGKNTFPSIQQHPARLEMHPFSTPAGPCTTSFFKSKECQRGRAVQSSSVSHSMGPYFSSFLLPLYRRFQNCCNPSHWF